MTRHSGETTITKHVHDGLDGGISNLFDEASLPAPDWSWLDHVNLGTGLQDDRARPDRVHLVDPGQRLIHGCQQVADARWLD
jgi:hypothetical protein